MERTDRVCCDDSVGWLAGDPFGRGGSGLSPRAESRNAAPARNQQTGCSGTGSESTPVTRRSTSADERVAVSDVAGAADQRVLPPDQIERHVRAEIAGMHRHSIADVGEQLGRRSDEYRDVVTGGDRLTQHVAAERSSGAQDEDAGHQHFTAFPAPAIPATGDRAIPAQRCKAGSRPARSWRSTRCSEVTLLRQKAPGLSRTSLA